MYQTEEVSAPFTLGKSPQMQEVYKLVQKTAQSNSTVLITGETGVGKELVSRMIHLLSDRKGNPFVCVNCAALSANLLESELFGHEKGSFTGADITRIGRFELADKGSLLLDEVSEIDIRLQAKLLRALEEKKVERVGSSLSMKIDVHIIATSNRNLSKMVAEGSFRADFYFRLNVIPIYIPSLRERREDIIPLIHHFLGNFKRHNQMPVKTLHETTLEMLVRYDWPGNVRELFNILERAMVLTSDHQIMPDDIAQWLNETNRDAVQLDNLIGSSLEEVEKETIRVNLIRHKGSRSRTAQVLGIADRTLRHKIKIYNIVV